MTYPVPDRDAAAVAAMLTRFTRSHPKLADRIRFQGDSLRWARTFRTQRHHGRYVYVRVRGLGARIIGYLADRVTVVPNRRNPYRPSGGFTQNAKRTPADPVVRYETRPRAMARPGW
jgi:hypothetical protein